MDYVLSLNGSNRHLAERLSATPVLIPDSARGPRQPRRDDRPPASGSASRTSSTRSSSRSAPGSRRASVATSRSAAAIPDAEMFMGIGNLTELTEADTTGVTALLIGFCQELGIRNVLTTEVIHWARGAVQEAVLAAQLMHFAHRARDAAEARRRPAGDRQGRRSSAPTRRPSCASCTRRSPIRTSGSSRTPTGSTSSTPTASSRAPTSTRSSTSSASTRRRTPSTSARS